jgi:hypothetical protein
VVAAHLGITAVDVTVAKVDRSPAIVVDSGFRHPHDPSDSSFSSSTTASRPRRAASVTQPHSLADATKQRVERRPASATFVPELTRTAAWSRRGVSTAPR